MNGIFINVDSQTFWHDSRNMDRDGVIRDVDFYTKNGGVEAVFYNMNFQRAYFDSKVFTPLWKDCEVRGDDFYFRGGKCKFSNQDQMQNLLLMRRNCPDFMQVRYDRCHENGAEMWNSMRMNDVHWSQLGSEHNPQHSDLWRARKDLLRAWYRHTWRGIWTDGCFDYAQKEVYDYHLAFARELMMEFRSDGIELDFLRAAPIFKPGFDEINAHILTQFIRDVRKVCDEAAAKWGHRMRIAVRVPSGVEDTLMLGMDVTRWCEEKLIDVLIAGPNSVASEIDPQLAIWKQILPPDVIFAPGIDYLAMSRRDQYVTFSESTDCGFASALYQLGADTLYFYNHFPTTQPEFPQMSEFFGYAADRRTVARKERRQLVTRHESVREGPLSFPPMHPEEIWVKSGNGSTKVNAGENVAGRESVVVIGFDREVEADVFVNTEKCELIPGKPQTDKYPAKIPFWIQARIPAGVLHDGWNAVELFNQSETQSIFGREIAWMEIRIAAE